MAIIENITTSNATYEVICGKNIIERVDNQDITASDIQNIKEHCENEISDYFEETEFNIKVLNLKSTQNLPQEYTERLLRLYYADNEGIKASKAFRAKALIEWRNNTKYCCKCGSELQISKTFAAKECPSCKQIIFPRIDPCIIVVVNKDDKILLARHVQRNQDIYACIAGFMEAGESAEQAVEREIREEVGLKVKNIKYRGSQSWPFPQQLMLGFTAEYESGDITLQPEEIADAQWFDRDNCPACPKPGSIAYKLIHKLY